MVEEFGPTEKRILIKLEPTSHYFRKIGSKTVETSFPKQCTMRDKVFINSVIKDNLYKNDSNTT